MGELEQPAYIDPARTLIAAAYKLLHPDSQGEAPKVLDPFAGGGAIPLEALRLGCEAHAVDLNPVAHLIELCTLVYPQKYGQPDRRPVPEYIKRLIAHNKARKKARSGVGNHIRAFQFTNAVLGTSPTSSTSTTFGYPGATPSISSNGTDNGILWAVQSSEGSLAVLHAYDANNLSNELYNSNQAGPRDHFGSGNKFITPVIANGEVFVGTSTGVGVFGLLSPALRAARSDGHRREGRPAGSTLAAVLLAATPFGRLTSFGYDALVSFHEVSAPGLTVGPPLRSSTEPRLLPAAMTDHQPNKTSPLRLIDGWPDSLTMRLADWAPVLGMGARAVDSSASGDAPTDYLVAPRWCLDTLLPMPHRP